MWQLMLALTRYRLASACALSALVALSALGLALLWPGAHPLLWVFVIQIVAYGQWSMAFGKDQTEQRLMLHGVLPLRRWSIALARLSMSWIVALLAAILAGLLATVLTLLGRTSAQLELWQASFALATFLLFTANSTYLVEEMNLRVRHSRLLTALLSTVSFLPIMVFSGLLGASLSLLSPGHDLDEGVPALYSALWEHRLEISLCLLGIALLMGAWSGYLFQRRERLDLRTSPWLGMETVWGGR